MLRGKGMRYIVMIVVGALTVAMLWNTTRYLLPHSTDLLLLRAGCTTETKDAYKWSPLNRSDVQNVETFFFFIGWPRSCHSIIGSMLDAHPNVVVAHEYSLFRQLMRDRQKLNRTYLYNMLYKNSYKTTIRGWRNSRMGQKGYTLHITDSWQGRFSKLKTIGDRIAGETTRYYSENPVQFVELYQQLMLTLQVPIKVLHVVRNPYDMIATISLYRGSQALMTKVDATISHKYSNSTILNGAADYVLTLSQAVSAMIPDLGLTTHELHCEDLIKDPKLTMSKICMFLNINCTLEYLKKCEEKTFHNFSRSRYLVDWSQELQLRVAEQIQKFPFFQRYSFDN